MSSEMREYVAALRDREHRFHGMGGHYVAEVIRGELEDILARTEAGADGKKKHPFAFYNADTGRFFWLNETEGAPESVTGVVNLYTHPQDASGDAERYRWLRTGLYSENIAIGEAELNLRCYGAAPTLEQFDAAIDAAMQAKEAK